MTRVRRALVATALAVAAVAGSGSAAAQQWVPSGIAELASGIEGGGGRRQALGRARTRLRIGADLHVDESPEDNFGAAVLLDIEPRAAFGLDVRYSRTVDRFAFGIGAIGYVSPGTLVGPAAVIEYRHPMSKAIFLTAGPEANVFVVGVDLPDKTVLWQALFHLGLRVGF